MRNDLVAATAGSDQGLVWDLLDVVDVDRADEIFDGDGSIHLATPFNNSLVQAVSTSSRLTFNRRIRLPAARGAEIVATRTSTFNLRS
jgi:hypothetical protein